MTSSITEARAEKMIDARVMRRLATDRVYLHAEDAEAQATREEVISREETEKVYSQFTIRDW